LDITVPYTKEWGRGGVTDSRNVHPFSIENLISVSHNGIISGFGNKEFSDTAMFVQKILTPILKDNYKLIQEKALQFLLLNLIGSWNKIVFLDKDGDYVILNEDNGFWVDQIWYSNGGGVSRFADTQKQEDLGDETSIEDRNKTIEDEKLESTDPDDFDADEEEIAMGLAWAHRTGRSGPAMRACENPNTETGHDYPVHYGPNPDSKILGLPAPIKIKESKEDAIISPKSPQNLDEIKKHDDEVVAQLAGQGVLDVGI